MVTEREISEVDRDCARQGVSFVALTPSNPPQDNPNAQARAAYEKRLSVDHLDYPDQRIQQLGAREPFQVFSLAAPIPQYAETHHVELHGFANSAPGIGHRNELGHEVAGELIAARICEMIGQRSGIDVRNLEQQCSNSWTDLNAIWKLLDKMAEVSCHFGSG